MKINTHRSKFVENIGGAAKSTMDMNFNLPKDSS